MAGSDIVTTSNATIDLAPNGTGTVVVRGNTNSGAIVFNCESNSHGQKVIAQPHSASVTNTLLLPASGNSTLMSLISTDTLTNKTLTAASNTVGLLTLDIDGGTEIGAAIVDADVLIIDDGAGGTNRKVLASRIKTYTNADLEDPTALAIALG